MLPPIAVEGMHGRGAAPLHRRAGFMLLGSVCCHDDIRGLLNTYYNNGCYFHYQCVTVSSYLLGSWPLGPLPPSGLAPRGRKARGLPQRCKSSHVYEAASSSRLLSARSFRNLQRTARRMMIETMCHACNYHNLEPNLTSLTFHLALPPIRILASGAVRMLSQASHVHWGHSPPRTGQD